MPSDYATWHLSLLLSAADFPVSHHSLKASVLYTTPDISHHFANANICGEDTANYWSQTFSSSPLMMNFLTPLQLPTPM